MKTIDQKELKKRLDRSENVKLVMALGRQAYEKAHIPGSLNFEDVSEAAQVLYPEDEIVLYDSNPHCPASFRVYQALRSKGFHKLLRYAGGLEDWQTAGNPLEGNFIP